MSLITRLDLVKILAPAVLFAFAHVGPVAAQTFPDKPIRMIVPFAPGGAGDSIGRLVARGGETEIGKPIVVENRPGASGLIGLQYAARAKPDGYDILQISTVNTINEQLKPTPVTIEKDFRPIVGVGSFPILLAVSGDSGIKTVDDLRAFAKSSKGGVVYASGGVGSVGHLTAAQFLKNLGITGTHLPFPSTNLAMQSLAGGHAQLFFPQTVDALQLANSDRIRLLGVFSDKRLPAFPDVPTMAELGFGDKGFRPRVWYGYLAPAKTPDAVVATLGKALTAAMNDPEQRKRLEALSFQIDPVDADTFAKFMADESARWKDVVVNADVQGAN